ncbi:hypothetical protein SprV_0301045100 [Sparganum proliferum]
MPASETIWTPAATQTVRQRRIVIPNAAQSGTLSDKTDFSKTDLVRVLGMPSPPVWPLPIRPRALHNAARTSQRQSMDENIPSLRQLLQEIKQELVTQRKKMDFLSEEVIWLKTNMKDIKAMLADNRRTLETVSFVSKEKPPVVQLPLRTADDYEDFVSKTGLDREIAEETGPYVTTDSTAAAIQR